MTERQLFETYNKDVFRMCYYMLRNKSDSEDVCQEVFITHMHDFAIFTRTVGR